MTSQKSLSNNRLPKDRILYCDRCGISFLWSGEEQQAASTHSKADASEEPSEKGRKGTVKIPTHCAGCLHLMPDVKRERGVVKWYNSRKRFGFITREDGTEIFAHGSRLKNARRLRDDALVEFSITETERGPAAANIHILEESLPE